MADAINPKHYQNRLGWDIINFTEELNFNRGNAIKYIFRAGKKYPDLLLEDLEKAKWYLEREINRIKSNDRGEVQAPAMPTVYPRSGWDKTITGKSSAAMVYVPGDQMLKV